eukprot:2043165-Amphidinium_carterae.1
MPTPLKFASYSSSIEKPKPEGEELPCSCLNLQHVSDVRFPSGEAATLNITPKKSIRQMLGEKTYVKPRNL